jgi:hypothetical protein
MSDLARRLELEQRLIEADQLVSRLHDMLYSTKFDLTGIEAHEASNRLIWQIHDVLRGTAIEKPPTPDPERREG